MPRGGKRPGAGRPTSAAREEVAEKAARKVVEDLAAGVDPYSALQKVLAYHDRAFSECAAKLPYANRTNAYLISKAMLDHSVAIRLTAEQLSKFAPTQEDAPRSVIRAPEPCTTTEEWLEKYGPAKPESESPAPAASAQLRQFAEAASGPPPKPKFVWDADQPPARTEILQPWPHLTGFGPHEFGALGAAQIADLKRRGRL